jgi:hypothetical protein
VGHDDVAPHACDPMVVPHGEALLERGNPLASTGDTCRDAAAQARRAERAIEGGVVSVPQALNVSSSALRMHAQRVARCDHDCTRNALPPKA